MTQACVAGLAIAAKALFHRGCKPEMAKVDIWKISAQAPVTWTFPAKSRLSRTLPRDGRKPQPEGAAVLLTADRAFNLQLGAVALRDVFDDG